MLLWPLLPLTMYQRIEFRDGVITSKGKLMHRGPVRVVAGSPVRLVRDFGGWGMAAPLYRVLMIGSTSSGESIRMLIAYWGGWQQLLDAVDPEHRVQRTRVETLADIDNEDDD